MSKTAASKLSELRAQARNSVITLDARFKAVDLPQHKPPADAPLARKLAHAMATKPAPINLAAKTLRDDLLKAHRERVHAVDAIENDAADLVKTLSFIRGTGTLPSNLPPHVASASRVLRTAHAKGLGQDALAEAIQLSLSALEREIRHTRETLSRCYDAALLGSYRQQSGLYERASKSAQTPGQADAFVTLALRAAVEFNTRSERYVKEHAQPDRDGRKSNSKTTAMIKALQAGSISVTDLITERHA